MITPKSLTEFQAFEPADKDFTPPQVSVLSLRALHHGGDATPKITPFERDEFGTWKASRWIGSFRYNNDEYTIRPRIGQVLFNRIALEAISVAVLPEGTAPSRPTLDHSGDLITLVWCWALRRARQRQDVPRLYINRAGNRATVLGQIDLYAQLTRNMFVEHRIACRWNELRIDNPITARILLVIDALSNGRRFPFTSRGNGLTRELEDLRNYLLQHGVPPQPDDSATPRFSRANDLFRDVHRLGKAILQRRGANAANSPGEALLLDSAEIWELFLFRSIQRVIHDHPHLSIEWPRDNPAQTMLLEWNGTPTRALIPDIVITQRDVDGTERKAILDAKYRAYAYASPLQDHGVVDQMALYAMTGGQSAPPHIMLLLYPRVVGEKGLNSELDEEVGQGRFRFGAGIDVELVAWSVPLNIDEKKFWPEVSDSLHKLLELAFPDPGGETSSA